jgi:hypothetical protein
MLGTEIIPGFKLEPVTGEENQLDHVRIRRTKRRRNLFLVLQGGPEHDEHEEKLILIDAIRKHGGLAVYDASTDEEHHGSWNLPTLKDTERPVGSTTRYARNAEVLAAVRSCTNELLALERLVTFQDGNLMDEFRVCSDTAFADSGNEHDADMYLTQLCVGLENDHQKELATCIGALDERIPIMFEQTWKPGNVVLSIEELIMHRRHLTRKPRVHESPLSSTSLWHTDSWQSENHILYYPHGAEKDQVIRSSF